MAARPHVLVATPCYAGMVTQTYLHSILKLTAYATARRIDLTLRTANDSLITRGRNAMVADFLDTPGATHLMFIDADIGFEPELVGRFLTMDEDLVAGLYPVKGLDWSGIARACAGGQASVEQAREAGLHFVGTPLTGAEREEREGFVTGKYAGTGFLMIRRSAVERMAEAYPELHYRCAHVHPAPGRVSEHLFDLFAPLIEPDTRTYLSEDYSFCHRWRAIGGKLWLDATARLKHVGGYEFQGTPPLELARVDLPRCA